MIRLKISSKVLFYFLLVSLLPLFVVNLILGVKTKSLLLNEATTKQQTIATSTADRVNSYINDKLIALDLQSQLLSTNPLNLNTVSKNFGVLIGQDSNIQNVSLLDPRGRQIVTVNTNGSNFGKVDQSNSDSYKAVEYLAGKVFISSVSYNSNGHPLITIAVPILPSNVRSASAIANTTPDQYLGVIVAKYDINELWNSVLSTKIGNGGYAYVVDGLGNLIAHPANQFFNNNQKVNNVQAVSRFINGNYSTATTISETGQQVVSTPKKLLYSNWAVIVQEPVSSIYSGINSFARLSVVIILIAAIFAISLSLIFRRQLINPINQLIMGTKRVSGGDFKYVVKVKSNDELHDLATTFNTMSQQIDRLINDLNDKNINLNHLTSQLSIANEQLKTANSNKDDFISMASHQLGTPLAAIDGYLSLASGGYYGYINEKLQASIKSALGRVQVMKSLLIDLLDVSRMTANRLYLDVVSANLNEIVKEEVKEQIALSNQSEVQLIFHPPTQAVPMTNIDQQKTRQAVMNLINNAINYSLGGKVEVYLYSDTTHIYFKVVDNGIGVADINKPNLFKKFFRADNAKKYRPDGTGIGLYLVRRVVEDQGGKIIFDSELGKGSTFGFALPIHSTLALGQHLAQTDHAENHLFDE